MRAAASSASIRSAPTCSCSAGRRPKATSAISPSRSTCPSRSTVRLMARGRARRQAKPAADAVRDDDYGDGESMVLPARRRSADAGVRRTRS